MTSTVAVIPMPRKRKITPKLVGHAYVVQFRHSALPDKSGDPGRVVKKSLGTADLEDALKYTTQLEQLCERTEHWPDPPTDMYAPRVREISGQTTEEAEGQKATDETAPEGYVVDRLLQ